MTLVLLVVAAACRPVTPPPAPAPGTGDPGQAPVPPEDPAWNLQLAGRYDTELGAGAAEIVAYGDGLMVVVNALENTLDFVDLSDPTDPQLTDRVDMARYGGGVNSVDVRGTAVVAAVEADPKTGPGRAVFLTTDGDVVSTARTGAQPDMVTFSPDGQFAVVANEGEPDDDYAVDPEGSITVIKAPLFTSAKPDWQRSAPGAVRQVRFTAFDEGASRHDELGLGVRVFGPGASVAQDLEPEYVAVSPGSTTAYVTLQENNAVATVDLRSGRISRIDALAGRDFSAGGGLDPSDRDGAVAIANHPVTGLPMPDAIAATRAGSSTYYMTANEGDAREWGDYEERLRVKDDDYVLDPAAYPDAAALKEDPALGRLNATTASGDTDGDGDYDRITAFGTRSFSIWDAATGARVFDSGDDFEQITALTDPEWFNSNNDEDGFDSRSDDKGPEPEAITTGAVDGRTYAFIGLERVGGVMVYDVTDPTNPTYHQYINPRTFGGGEVGPDSGPEGLEFVPASVAPGGQALLLASNEVTGTVTVYRVADPDGAGTLSLLHNNDGESTITPLTYSSDGTEYPVAGVSAFASVIDREAADARADLSSVLNVYAGDAFLASAALTCSLPPNPASTPVYDAEAQKRMDFDAHIFGNHEFDYSPDFLERFVRGFDTNGVRNQPFLSANLDLSGEPGWADLVDGDGLIVGHATDGRTVARSLIHTDPFTGARFGVVGATTPDLPSISSPRNVAVTSSDAASTAAVVQAEVDRLSGLGVQKVILVSHLQAVANDQELVGLLRDVDVAVAGGGDDLLANDEGELLPGEAAPIVGDYPLLGSDVDGATVPIVTTAGNYKYLGRLDVRFDDAGEVVEVLTDSGPKRVAPESDGAATLGLTDAVVPDADVEGAAVDPVEECQAELAEPIIGTEVVLDTSRAGARSRESNTGNSVADAYIDSYVRYAAANGLPAAGPENPVVAIQNGGGIRQNAGDTLPTTGAAPGTISRLDTNNVLAFFNTQTVVQDVTATELEGILEHAAANVGGGAFLQIGGIRVTYDTSRQAEVLAGTSPDRTVATAGQRVVAAELVDGTDLIVDGTPAPGAPAVDIVTNSFTAGGGDDFVVLRDIPASRKVQLFDADGTTLTYQQSWVEYLLSFPVEIDGLPTIQADDPRYQPGGDGRITLTTSGS
ncbi:choice-of-anchor I family protein [Iamia majanohamensis]|uniref:Choice-of-anchor I family protein n=1 Tax=Iamia majanohamensis TaxID=467976 RepID=A0AAE9Y6V9_9ACTN|nr:choice-of-anchor I family protein [Iamia majanohamensis]WCO65369.1 choice-of-anchor I family protein [Iamia majanohamensis]